MVPERVLAWLASLPLLAPLAQAAPPQGGLPALLVTADTPAGGALLALDPLSGARTTIAVWRAAELTGVASAPGGAIFVLDAGPDGAPPRVLAVDARAGTRRTLSAGGFLRDPRQCTVLGGGDLLVVDRRAAGSGALVRIEAASGVQRLVSFGSGFAAPVDLALDPAGNALVLDRFPLRVDALTGRQTGVACAAAPFARPSAFELLPAGGALVCDGGALYVLDTAGARGTSVRGLPAGIRDVALGPEGNAYCLWSADGQGGVQLVFPQGTSTTLVRGPEYAGLRAIAYDARLDLGGPIGDEETAVRHQAPPRPSLPPVSIELRAQTVTLLNGPGPADDVVLPAGPYPLATALRAATPGSDPVIGVFGEIPGALVSIGGGDSDLKAYVAHWGAVPMRFAVVGQTSDARIREFSVWQRMNDGRVNGGVVDALFQDLTIEARYSQCVGGPKGHQFGLLRFYGCRFVPDRASLAQGSYGGFGYKWGIRSQARGRWDLRGCTFAPVLEHAVYVDSPQGDCVFLDLTHLGSTRTAIQVVNRSFDNPGPSGFGTLLFEDVRISGLYGDGGSGITVAGHLGDLVFRDVRARAAPPDAPSHGAIVVWADAAPQHGLYLHRAADGRLYSTRRVTIESTDIRLPAADRALIAIAGAEEVVIDGFTVQGNRPAFAFDSPFGVAEVTGPAVVDGALEQLDRARVANGRVLFRLPCPLSAYPGFRSPEKIQVGTQRLSDAAIDSTWCGP